MSPVCGTLSKLLTLLCFEGTKQQNFIKEEKKKETSLNNSFFKSSALSVDAFYKFICSYVCLSVCLCVCVMKGVKSPRKKSFFFGEFCLTSRIFLVSVQLSALVERCFVSRMRDFFLVGFQKLTRKV